MHGNSPWEKKNVQNIFRRWISYSNSFLFFTLVLNSRRTDNQFLLDCYVDTSTSKTLIYWQDFRKILKYQIPWKSQAETLSWFLSTSSLRSKFTEFVLQDSVYQVTQLFIGIVDKCGLNFGKPSGSFQIPDVNQLGRQQRRLPCQTTTTSVLATGATINRVLRNQTHLTIVSS